MATSREFNLQKSRGAGEFLKVLKKIEKLRESV